MVSPLYMSPAPTKGRVGLFVRRIQTVDKYG